MQIHPHFLFNTLNSIAALIAENPGKAEATVEKLSELFRYTLQSSASTTVKLSDELDIVRSYLEIEKVRFGDRLEYDMKVDDALLEMPIPGLVIQTLVENSIKHGIAPQVYGGRILIDARQSHGKCVITVSDSGRGFGKNDGSGFGLKSIRERLRLLYGERARIEILHNDATQVVMTIPLVMV